MLKEFVTPLHESTTRDYLARMNDDKAECMKIAMRYDHEYWDGPRRYGYGGYSYIPGRWKPVAEALMATYELVAGSTILDVGCGKGFLLHEMLLIEPNLRVTGIDISAYAIQNSTDLVRPCLTLQSAEDLSQFQNKQFDLVVSLGTLHNLPLSKLSCSIRELERVGNRGYIMVESYRDALELFNLQCWALTCRSFYSDMEWVNLFQTLGYQGDYEFIYFT